MSEETFDLTITIVSWNTKDLLRGCLQSLARGATKISYEIHVVDNNSADKSAEMVKEEFPSVRLFANKENLGFARANNQSWREARGRYWLLLNSDTEARNGTFDNLVDFMDTHPKAGLATARLNYADETLQHCAQPNPAIWRILFEALRLHKLLPKSLRGKILLGTYFNYEEAVRIGWAWGTALIARREAVKDAGALSADFFMYGEDLEWCLRLQKHGWQVWFVPHAKVLHFKEQSSAVQWNNEERKRKMLNGFFKALEIHRGKLYVKTFQVVSLFVWKFENFLARLSGKQSNDVKFLADYYNETLKRS